MTVLTYAALVLAVLTILVARARGRRLAAVAREVRALGYLEGSLRELRKDMDARIGITRRHLASVGEGRRLAADQILEGKPFADVGAVEAQRMVEEAGAFVLDVRSPGEFASRHIPGALLVPVDQLERRLAELPPPATTMLVTCAGGARSAAACALLADRGYGSLFNLAVGMNGWRGKTESGAPA